MKYAFFLLALIAVASATADIMNEFEEDSTQETPIEETEEPQEPQEENKMSATEGEEEVAEAKKTPPEEPQAINAAGATYINIAALNAQISKVIDLKFRKEPVIQLLYLTLNSHRRLSIERINGGSLKKGKLLETISIGHGRASKTGRYLAYRPRYQDYHNTKLGAMFLNLDRIFPCAKSAHPFCRRFTTEEDGFLRGKAIIEAADHGNNFKVFGGTDTYGMAFQGCGYLDGHNGCLPTWFQTTIACFLPRSCA